MKVENLAGSNSLAGRTRRPSFAVNLLWLALLIPGVQLSQARAQQALVLVGSGSTVPAPLYNRWTQEFGKHNPKIQMRYLPIGTEEGINEIAHGTGDFGAGEAPLSEKQQREDGLTGLPVALIGIVPVYNLPGVHQELRLSGEVLAGIFLGTVKTWNAPEIAKLNPDVALPNTAIRVVYRPAGKGSNYVFTDFLSKTSTRFRAQIGVGPSPKWPVGESAERSSDMAEKVKNTPDSIGYVEYQYAVKESIPQAAVLNAAGKYVKASSQGIADACEQVETPRWHSFSASLVNARGEDSFPIASFTWIYFRSQASDTARAAAQSSLLNWIYSDGQRLADQEGYTALPPQLVVEVKKKLSGLH